MKIVIPGGSGQIGQALARSFYAAGHEVVVLSRAPQAVPWRVVMWDGRTLGTWAGEVDGADVVINLTGRSVNCRYTPANRQAITASRVDSTRVVGVAIARAGRPPRVWLQASTATVYTHRFDAFNDEATGLLDRTESDAPDTWRFSVGVGLAWERALDEAVTPHTRKVKLRTSLMMSPAPGGVFDVLLRLVRFGLGGRAGDGRQYVSWMHDVDYINAIHWLLAHEDLEGPVILAAPEPLPHAEFMRELRAAWGQPVGLPAARWMLELGAFFLRTETELILKSRRVTPGRLLQAGFTFQFPTWAGAARDLCRRWRERT